LSVLYSIAPTSQKTFCRVSIGLRANAGTNSIAIGQDAFASHHQSNIALGFGARATGAGDIVIGGGTVNSVYSWTYGNIVIGKQARMTHANAGLFGVRAHGRATQPVSRANNQIVMGSPGVSTVGFSAWSNVSDERDKKDIKPLSYDPVAFIKGLKPKQFKYDIRQCYRHIEEINEDEFNALPEYEKRHRIISMPVFGLQMNGDDGKEGQRIEGFEWINEYAYLGITSKSEDPTCLENCKGDTPFEALTLSDIPKITTLNAFVASEDIPHKPTLKSTFFRDYYEALAAWKLSKCTNAERLTTQEAAIPLIDKYCYPTKALRNDAGEIITDEKGNWVFEQDPEGNPTLVWPFPRKASSFDPRIKQNRTAYFHIVEAAADGTYAGKRDHSGFIAQEVEELANSMGFDFAGVQYFGHHKDENGVPQGDDTYALALEEMTAPIVATLQHVLETNEALEAQNKALEQRLAALELRLK